MQIGKAGTPVSHIAQGYPDRIEVRDETSPAI